MLGRAARDDREVGFVEQRDLLLVGVEVGRHPRDEDHLRVELAVGSERAPARELVLVDTERLRDRAQRVAGDDAIEHALLACDRRVLVGHGDDHLLAVFLIRSRRLQLRLRLRTVLLARISGDPRHDEHGAALDLGVGDDVVEPLEVVRVGAEDHRDVLEPLAVRDDVRVVAIPVALELGDPALRLGLRARGHAHDVAGLAGRRAALAEVRIEALDHGLVGAGRAGDHRERDRGRHRDVVPHLGGRGLDGVEPERRAVLADDRRRQHLRRVPAVLPGEPVLVLAELVVVVGVEARDRLEHRAVADVERRERDVPVAEPLVEIVEVVHLRDRRAVRIAALVDPAIAAQPVDPRGFRHELPEAERPGARQGVGVVRRLDHRDVEQILGQLGLA